MLIPGALAREYPNAGRELGWQYLFPASHRTIATDEKGRSWDQRHRVSPRFVRVKRLAYICGATLRFCALRGLLLQACVFFRVLDRIH
jgi:hypothetical protein